MVHHQAGPGTFSVTIVLKAVKDGFNPSDTGNVAQLPHAAVVVLATDNGRACALEYNVVAWGRAELAPQAGIAVYVRGDSGKLAIARIYDDADPPLSDRS